MYPIYRRFFVYLLMLLAAALGACERASPEDQIASAKRYLAKGELKSASIDLKDALDQNPDLAEARFLLGEALLERREPVGAVVELRKAQDLNYPQNAIAPLMVRALVEQGKAEQALLEYGRAELTDPIAVAALKTALGKAYIATGQRDLAETELNAAIAAVPGYAPALIVRASTVAPSDPAAAMDIVDKVLRASPADADAWILKGDLLARAKPDSKDAVEAYRKAAAARPEDLVPRWALVGTYARLNDFKAAKDQLEELHQLAPQHAHTLFLEASVALQQGELDRAREIAQSLLKVASDNAAVQQLAGAIELRKGNAVLAERHLRLALQLAPGSQATMLALAQAQLQSGQPAKALATIEPSLAQNTPPPQALSLAGIAQLRSGDVERAEALLERAVAANPDDPKGRTALAVARLYGNNARSAAAELDALADADADTTADLALIGAAFRQLDFAAALKALDRLEKKQGGRALALNLRGRLLLLRGDFAEARRNFEEAIEINPQYFPAIESLSALDLRDGRPDLAEKRFEKLLKLKPDSAPALAAIAQLRAGAGESKEEVVGLLQRGVAASPAEAAPRLLLIDYLLQQKDFSAALQAAQVAVSALPDNTELLGLLARAQLANRDFNQAITTFDKLANLNPRSPQAALALADAYLAAGQTDAALRTVKRALEIDPRFLPAQHQLLRLEQAAGRKAEALAVARSVQTQRPNEAVGFLYEGDVHAVAKDWSLAIAAYRQALKKQPSNIAVQKLYATLLASGQRKEADNFSSSWLKGHPTDAGFLNYLGTVAAAMGNLAGAEEYFRQVIKIQPANAAALDGLASTMVRLNEPGAVSFAEKANRLQPNRPAFMETWAMALAQENQLPKSLEIMKKAVSQQPDNPSLRLALAKLHLKAGDRGAAREELERLGALGESFPGYREVQRLQARL